MARIAGVNLPNQKRLEIGLTYIYGIGQSTAQKICNDARLDPGPEGQDLTDDEVTKLRNYIDANLEVEGDLRRERTQAIKRLAEIGCLPRHPPPPRPAGARPAHEDERAHAQGPEEDRRPRQEGEVAMAPPRKAAARGRTRRRVQQEHRDRPGAHQDVVQQHDRLADRQGGERDRVGVRRLGRASRARASRRRSPRR